jgi:pentatricopeptide repeat protein
LKMVKQLLKDMVGEGVTPDVVTYSTLINMFAKLGDLGEAERVLKQMTASGFVPDVVVFDSLMKGYSAEGQTNKVLELIHEMRAKNVALDTKIVSTIISTLMASNEHKSLVVGLPNFSQELQKGETISPQEFMESLYGSCPTLEPGVA